MCGITGHWSFSEKKINRQNFNSFNLLNSFRGIDGDGVKYFLNDNLALGHTRLSILDLSNLGSQPLQYENDKYSITFNGEIYNYLEIKDILLKLNYKFKSNTDTEVIIVAYIEWGFDCIEKFEGMFSFAIFDSVKELLFCARDSMGIKPFYYTFSNKNFIFSSSIFSIFKYSEQIFTINTNSLIQNVNFDMCFRPNTLFNEIMSLEKGTYIILDRNAKLIKKQYYHLPVSNEKLNLTEKEALFKLDELLNKSTKQQLVADVEISTFMSGGIDSSLITAISKKYNPDIKAFTLCFDKQLVEFDELNEAVLIAKHLNVNHIIKKIGIDDFIEKLETSMYFSDEPLGGVPPSFMLSEFVKKHNIKVTLNGLGGDELFAGYQRYNYKEFEWFLLNNQQLIYKIKNKFVKENFNNKLSNFYCNTLSRFTSLESNNILNFKTNNLAESFSQIYNPSNLKFDNFMDGISYYDMKFYLGEYQLDGVDQLNMANSIEGRFPFLNKEIVDFAFKLPNEFKVKNCINKYLLKKIATNYLPKEIINMPKKGFGIPNNYWFEDNTSGEIIAKEKINNLLTRGYFKNDTFTKNLMFKNRAKFVALELWFQKFYGK